MSTVLYSAIRPANSQRVSDVIRQAARMGYTMTIFNGWSDADLGGRAANKGPHRAEADKNARILREIQDACELSGDWPHIIDVDAIPADYQVA